MDLTGISQITTAANSLANLILVTPQEEKGYQAQVAPSYQNSGAKPGKAFLFDYEGEQTVTLESDISDHYTEENSAIQDQIALRPEIVSTHGYIGELNNVPPPILKPLNDAAQRLTSINVYTPTLSAAAIIAYNEAAFLYQVGNLVLNAGVSAWSSINGGGGPNGPSQITSSGVFNSNPNQNKQQIGFMQFYGYWSRRTLFTIQTPWAIFRDMAIKTLRAVQDPDTRVYSSFEITFKMLRFAATQNQSREQFPADAQEGRARNKARQATELANSKPKDDIALSSKLGGF